MELSVVGVIVVAIAVVGFVLLVVIAVTGRHPDRQLSNTDQHATSETYRVHGPPNDRPAGADAEAEQPADLPAADDGRPR